MRTLDVADGFTASAAPTAGVSLAGGLSAYANDAAYVAANGTPAGAGQGAYWDTTLNVVKVWDGTQWVQCVTADGAQALTNKDYDGGTASNARRLTVPKSTFAAITALTRKAATLLFATDRSKLYVDDGSALRAVGGSGGGSALRWIMNDAGLSPREEFANGMRVFWYTQDGIGSEKMYCLVKVPSTYNAGDQINMILGLYTPATSNNCLIRSVATLLRAGTDAVTSTTNQRTSTNTDKAIQSTTNLAMTTTLDLTSSTGTINSVAVAAGDFILVELKRATPSGTDTSSDVAVLPEGTEVTFS